MEHVLTPVITNMYMDSHSDIQKDVNSFLKAIRYSLTFIYLSLPQNSLVMRWRKINYTWKHYWLAIEIYWENVMIVVNNIGYFVTLTKELQLISLAVHDKEHKCVTDYPSKVERVRDFCADYRHKLPLTIEKLFLKFMNDL